MNDREKEILHSNVSWACPVLFLLRVTLMELLNQNEWFTFDEINFGRL